MRQLARTFDVTVLCFERLGSAGQDTDVAGSLAHLRTFVEIELFPVPQNRSRTVYLANHLRSLATRRVYTRFVYRSRAFRRRLRELLATGEFDLVHMDSLDLSDYLGCIEGIPVACTHHNVESALLRRRAVVEGTLKGAYMRLQAKLMEQEERRCCPGVEVNVMCSSIDGEQLAELAPGARTAVVPNGVDIEEFRPGVIRGAPDPDSGKGPDSSVDGGVKGSVFVGGTSWFPNLDALEYFSQDILPLIRKRHPAYPVHWVGFSTAEQRERFAHEGITLTGYVDDVRSYVERASTFVVPLRAGGGTRLKILMAWAMGAAVVITSVGCEGLAAKDGVNILVRDTPEDFADAVTALEEDERERVRLGRAARRTAEEIYAWPVIGRGLSSLYHEIISEAASSVQTRGGL